MQRLQVRALEGQALTVGELRARRKGKPISVTLRRGSIVNDQRQQDGGKHARRLDDGLEPAVEGIAGKVPLRTDEARSRSVERQPSSKKTRQLLCQPASAKSDETHTNKKERKAAEGPYLCRHVRTPATTQQPPLSLDGSTEHGWSGKQGSRGFMFVCNRDLPPVIVQHDHDPTTTALALARQGPAVQGRSCMRQA